MTPVGLTCWARRLTLGGMLAAALAVAPLSTLQALGSAPRGHLLSAEDLAATQGDQTTGQPCMATSICMAGQVVGGGNATCGRCNSTTVRTICCPMGVPQATCIYA